MDNEPEFWNADEWGQWLTKHDVILSQYCRVLDTYNGLPAQELLTDNEMLRHVSADTYTTSLTCLLSPQNYLRHSWASANNEFHSKLQSEEEEMTDEEKAEMESALEEEFQRNQAQLQRTPLGANAVNLITDCVSLSITASRLWIKLLAFDTDALSVEEKTALLSALSQVAFFTMATHASLCQFCKPKAQALTVHTIKKLKRLNTLLSQLFQPASASSNREMTTPHANNGQGKIQQLEKKLLETCKKLQETLSNFTSTLKSLPVPN